MNFNVIIPAAILAAASFTAQATELEACFEVIAAPSVAPSDNPQSQECGIVMGAWILDSGPNGGPKWPYVLATDVPGTVACGALTDAFYAQPEPLYGVIDVSFHPQHGLTIDLVEFTDGAANCPSVPDYSW